MAYLLQATFFFYSPPLMIKTPESRCKQAIYENPLMPIDPYANILANVKVLEVFGGGEREMKILCNFTISSKQHSVHPKCECWMTC